MGLSPIYDRDSSTDEDDERQQFVGRRKGDSSSDESRRNSEDEESDEDSDDGTQGPLKLYQGSKITSQESSVLALAYAFR